MIPYVEKSVRDKGRIRTIGLNISYVLKSFAAHTANYKNQVELLEAIFHSFTESKEGENHPFDKITVNKWMHGKEKVPDYILDYYTKKGIVPLANDIYEYVFPKMTTPLTLISILGDCVEGDIGIDSNEKMVLMTDRYSEDENGQADFLAGVVMYALRTQKKISRKNPTLVSGSRVLAEEEVLIFNGDTPSACNYFAGRVKEIYELRDHLRKADKVYLSGIPGIGKSELVKRYIEIYGADYKKIIYLDHSGSLMEDIAALMFSTDNTTRSKKTRFDMHESYLRGLKKDSLIIVDNFHTTFEKDPYINTLLKYNCKVLVVTRGIGYGRHHMKLKEMSDPELYELSCNLFPESENWKDELYQMYGIVHRHTFVVELASRLMKTGMLEPDEVVQKLKDTPVALESDDYIQSNKDCRYVKETYHHHISRLFGMARLSEEFLVILKNISLVGTTGINKKSFATWMKMHNVNDINTLIELGFIQELEVRMLHMHAIIREVLYADYRIGFSECKYFLEAVADGLFETGKKQSYIRELYGIAKRGMDIVVVDDPQRYYLFLEKAAKSVVIPELDSEELRWLVKKMEEVRKDFSSVDISSEALLIFYRSVAYRNEKTFLLELKKAIEMFQVIDAGNIHKWYILHYVQFIELMKNQQYSDMIYLAKELRKQYEILQMDHSFEYISILTYEMIALRLQAAKEGRRLTEDEYTHQIKTTREAILEVLMKKADKNTDFEGFFRLRDGVEEMLMEKIEEQA